MKKIILFSFVLIFLIGCSNIKCLSCDANENRWKISHFDVCVEAGNPVMESHPRKCVANGEVFVEELDEPLIGGCGTVTPGYNDECCARSNENVPTIACVGEWKWLMPEARCKFVCTDAETVRERMEKEATAEPIKYDEGAKFIPCEKDSDCIFDRIRTFYPDPILPKCNTENFCKAGVCVYNCII